MTQKRGSSGTSWLGSSSVSKEKVKFFLYDKERNDGKFDPIEISPDNKYSLEQGNFDVKKLTTIIIHGYGGGKNSSVGRLVREGIYTDGYGILISLLIQTCFQAFSKMAILTSSLLIGVKLNIKLAFCGHMT